MQGVGQPWLQEIRRYRWQVDQLKMHVIMREHARYRMMGGVGVRTDVAVRSRQQSMHGRLPGVRRAYQAELRGALRAHDMRRTGTPRAFLWPGELLRKLLDPGLYVGLEVIGAFVLGDCAQHLAQAREALFRFACVAIGLFGFLVLG